VVKFLGYGTYVGDELPTTAAGWLAPALVEEGVTNPKLELDSGKVVWGCECWWGAESGVKAKIEAYREAGWEIVESDIDAIRAELTTDGEEGS
jgi:ABC-type proline/glycine betaine transport system substrate-binding protein